MTKHSHADRTSFGPLRIMHLVSGGGPTSIPIEIAKACRAESIEIDVLVAPPRASIAYVSSIVSLLTNSPDILHVHHATSALLPALLARLRGIRVVKTEHRDPRSLSRVAALAKWIVARVSPAVVFNSAATEQAWLAGTPRVFRSRLTLIIRNGVDLTEIPVTHVGGHETIRIFTAARIIAEKRHSLIAAALADLGSTEWHVVGDGPLLRALQEQVTELGIEKRVRFHGALERSDMFAILSSADISVYVSSTEGFCNAAAESLLAGVPLIVSSVPALTELAGDDAAATIQSDDPSELAAAIEAVTQNLDSIRIRAKTAASQRRVDLSMERCASQYVGLYRVLMGTCHSYS